MKLYINSKNSFDLNYQNHTLKYKSSNSNRGGGLDHLDDISISQSKVLGEGIGFQKVTRNNG